MTSYKISPLAMSVHPTGEDPILAVGVSHIRLDDEGGGQFLVLTQDDQSVRLGLQELEALLVAAKQLMEAKP